jgi:hypothetical protein
MRWRDKNKEMCRKPMRLEELQILKEEQNGRLTAEGRSTRVGTSADPHKAAAPRAGRGLMMV